jgi:hypothetical protein
MPEDPIKRGGVSPADERTGNAAADNAGPKAVAKADVLAAMASAFQPVPPELQAAREDWQAKFGRIFEPSDRQPTQLEITLAALAKQQEANRPEAPAPLAAELPEAEGDIESQKAERRRVLRACRDKWKRKGARVTDEMIGNKVTRNWKSRYQIQKWAACNPRYDEWDSRIRRVLSDDHIFDDYLSKRKPQEPPPTSRQR